MIVAATDGRSHYVELGTGWPSEMLDSPQIVRVNPLVPEVRQADRTIADVAAANGGIYSIDNHLRHDRSATQRFAEAHVRRLEAMRRGRGEVERLPDGSWKIAPDHLERVLRFEREAAATRPVEIETLSGLRLDQMTRHDGVTWLDEQNVAKDPEPLERGFGAEVRQALALRRQWLVEQGLAWRDGDMIHFRPGMMNELRRRELRQVAGQLSKELGLGYAEHRGGSVEGTYRRAVQVGSARYALVEGVHTRAVAAGAGEADRPTCLRHRPWRLDQLDVRTPAPGPGDWLTEIARAGTCRVLFPGGRRADTVPMQARKTRHQFYLPDDLSAKLDAIGLHKGAS